MKSSKLAMKCPKCGSEFLFGVGMCKSTDGKLVECCPNCLTQIKKKGKRLRFFG